MAANLEMAEMREEIERLRAENARLKETPEPSSQDLMEYPLEVKVEVEPEDKKVNKRKTTPPKKRDDSSFTNVVKVSIAPTGEKHYNFICERDFRHWD